MTRSLSADLRGRVIAAIEDGISTRAAARRFRIGISTAGNWYRRYRETGETEARKQGQPSRSKLDAHEAFILGLIEDAPDITLAEIGAPATSWSWTTCRLTSLVIESSGIPVRALWALMDDSDLNGAVEALRVREGIPQKGKDNFIGRWPVGREAPHVIPDLPRWAEGKGLNYVIWTALPPKFKNQDNRKPTVDEAVTDLRALEGRPRDEAEKYVRRAPRQIDTRYRRRFESELGWTPKGSTHT